MSGTETPQKRIRLTVPKDLEGPSGEDKQPVSAVRWVPREEVFANSYNPNHVPPPELRLLKISILSDGWTQPIVTRQMTGANGDEGPDGVTLTGARSWYEVVDGYHRWLVGEDPQLLKMTAGNVPVVVLADKPIEDLMMSTIRHNRARGNHHVMKMADIAHTMFEAGVPDDRIMILLQMEKDELSRLKDRGSMVKRGAGEDFGQGWVPS